jgi:lysophospholipid acyltransferase (LPLAT)-like uncharacterized protein
MRGGLRYSVLSGAGRLLIEALLRTCRYAERGGEHHRRYRDAGKPVIFVLWHGRLLPSAYLYRGQGVVALVSRSEDGEYIARILEQWGYRVARGSSSRGGGEALQELVQHLAEGRTVAITPDGPRGPREVMKPGPLLAAQRSGAPIIPAGVAADRAWWFGGWDRFMVPRPCARIRIVYGPPFHVQAGTDAEAFAARSRELEVELARLKEEAERWAG